MAQTFLTNEDKVLRYDEQTLTDEQKAQARANIGAQAEPVPNDEELLIAGVTWTSEADAGSNLIGHSMWTSSNPDTPTNLGESNNRFCTRKFETSRIPVVSFAGTNAHTCVFFKNGVVVKEIVRTELPSSLEVDFEFDHIAFNCSYGWSNFVSANPGTYISLSLPGATHFKKVLVVGDSISTDYYGSYTKWVTVLLNEKVFPIDTNNSSIHATGFVARYNEEANDFITRLEAVENKDGYELVVVFGGINDYIQAVPMGESGGDKTANFIPAVDYFFEYLVNNFTQARIVVLSPLRTSNIWNNTAGHHQTEYADYIKEVAKSYCLPVLNLTEESGFCPFNDTFKNRWTLIPEGYTDADGVHPNEEYQRKHLAPMIKGFLLSIKPD